MSEAIIVAIITAGATVFCQWLATRQKEKEKSTEEALFRQDVRNQLQSLKEENKEIKADLKEHNGYAQKFVETHNEILGIRQDIALIVQDNKHIKEKIKEYHG